MKHNQLGETVRSYRKGLGLTQQALAQQLEVEASHIAFIESGRRKPSLKLMGRLADILGLDGQHLFILAHPEAKGLIAEAKSKKVRQTSPSWRRFIENRELLTRYNVTDRELRILEHLSFLVTTLSAKEFLTFLTLIRDIPSSK
jgi:transcriptional regulator with XRE-family HTH domain